MQATKKYYDFGINFDLKCEISGVRFNKVVSHIIETPKTFLKARIENWLMKDREFSCFYVKILKLLKS